MNRRRNEEEWRRILVGQREQGLSDQDCCVQHGVTPSSLKRWRGRLGLGGSRGPKPFVELPAPAMPVAAGELRVILPNRIELALGHGWSVDQVVAMASRLAVL